jgi:hypothetical protein
MQVGYSEQIREGSKSEMSISIENIGGTHEFSVPETGGIILVTMTFHQDGSCSAYNDGQFVGRIGIPRWAGASVGLFQQNTSAWGKSDPRLEPVDIIDQIDKVLAEEDHPEHIDAIVNWQMGRYGHDRY